MNMFSNILPLTVNLHPKCHWFAFCGRRTRNLTI